MPDFSGRKTVDRLPVTVSNRNGRQILGAPLLPDETATRAEIASAVYDRIEDWGLLPTLKKKSSVILTEVILLRSSYNRSLMLSKIYFQPHWSFYSKGFKPNGGNLTRLQKKKDF